VILVCVRRVVRPRPLTPDEPVNAFHRCDGGTRRIAKSCRVLVLAALPVSDAHPIMTASSWLSAMSLDLILGYAGIVRSGTRPSARRLFGGLLALSAHQRAGRPWSAAAWRLGDQASNPRRRPTG
jgi:hypothetical protein